MLRYLGKVLEGQGLMPRWSFVTVTKHSRLPSHSVMTSMSQMLTSLHGSSLVSTGGSPSFKHALVTVLPKYPSRS